MKIVDTGIVGISKNYDPSYFGGRISVQLQDVEFGFGGMSKHFDSVKNWRDLRSKTIFYHKDEEEQVEELLKGMGEDVAEMAESLEELLDVVVDRMNHEEKALYNLGKKSHKLREIIEKHIEKGKE